MDWNAFLEKTRKAAGVESFAKLAPMIGVTDGAIHHYRVGRNVPQVWVIAECLRLQGHPEPEKQAVFIMKSEARTSPERTFYKKLAATTMLLLFAVAPALNPAAAYTTRAANCHAEPLTGVCIMRNARRLAAALIALVVRSRRGRATTALLA